MLHIIEATVAWNNNNTVAHEVELITSLLAVSHASGDINTSGANFGGLDFVEKLAINVVVKILFTNR